MEGSNPFLGDMPSEQPRPNKLLNDSTSDPFAPNVGAGSHAERERSPRRAFRDGLARKLDAPLLSKSTTGGNRGSSASRARNQDRNRKNINNQRLKLSGGHERGRKIQLEWDQSLGESEKRLLLEFVANVARQETTKGAHPGEVERGKVGTFIKSNLNVCWHHSITMKDFIRKSFGDNVFEFTKRGSATFLKVKQPHPPSPRRFSAPVGLPSRCCSTPGNSLHL